ncbi:MAG: SPASM domain-containing protein [Chlorobiales bacterium]|nr:SPASM domain-containing protein [Chlorobiales bacterium]
MPVSDLILKYRGFRSSISSDDWKEIFNSAEKRIWLLGYSMKKAVDREYSGGVIEEKLASGIDLRFVILDPYSKDDYQLVQISRAIDSPSLKNRIEEAVACAMRIEINANRIAKKKYNKQVSRIFSIGVTDEIIHNSIVIVDDRFIVTFYSTAYEMGNNGVTIEVSPENNEQKDICDFFEDEFLRMWKGSRPLFDSKKLPIRVEEKAYGLKRQIEKIKHWYHNGGELPPPRMMIIYPTYRCEHYSDGLCPNCMCSDILNGEMQDMPIEKFSELCEKSKKMGVSNVEISGGGDPLDYKYFKKLLEIVKSDSHSLKFGLLTNVAGISKVDNIDELLNAFLYIRLSWPEKSNNSSKNDYLKLIKKIVDRNTELQKKNGGYQGTRIGVKVLATKKNVGNSSKSLENLVKSLIDIGVNHIKVRPIRSSTMGADDRDLRKAQDALLRIECDYYKTKGKLSNGDTLEVDLRDREVKLEYKCWLSSLIAVVEPNGDMRMCWNDYEKNDKRVIGNLFDSDFGEVWGTKEHRGIVKETEAEKVCNVDKGCHCRVVGYQESTEYHFFNESFDQHSDDLDSMFI